MARLHGDIREGRGFKHEYLLDRVSAKSVWNQISTSRGLSEWFAPKVEVYGLNIHIFWDDKGDDREGSIVEAKDGVRIKWVWDDDPRSYVSMEIVTTELSHTISLMIEDVDRGLEPATLEALWESHIEKLKISLGVY